MFIKSIKLPKKYIFIVVVVSFLIFTVTLIINASFAKVDNSKSDTSSDYIKWFDFNVSYSVLKKTATIDINSHVNDEEIKLNWIELISYLACKYGNEFNKFKQKDLDEIVNKLKSGESISDITQNMKNYNYYYECYSSVLEEFIGYYGIEASNSNSKQNVENSVIFENKYGIKAFHPIAKGYSYNHYDDFGTSRSYGYKRLHFGNDLMGSIGTPIIATESGVVEALGWNQYGGWRIGIRSFNGKRYYYYAHLRKDHPYVEDMYEGKMVKAGDVIGYLGMTGYSPKENVNNINIPHLHFGLQLIFDESQKDGPNQIWVDLYPIVEFLTQNRSSVFMNNNDTKDYTRRFDIFDPIVPD